MSDPQYLIPGDAITLPNGNHAIVCARGYHGQDGMAYDFIATDKEVISLTHAEVKPDQIVRDFQWSDRHLEELKGKQPSEVMGRRSILKRMGQTAAGASLLLVSTTAKATPPDKEVLHSFIKTAWENRNHQFEKSEQAAEMITKIYHSLPKWVFESSAYLSWIYTKPNITSASQHMNILGHIQKGKSDMPRNGPHLLLIPPKKIKNGPKNGLTDLQTFKPKRQRKKQNVINRD